MARFTRRESWLKVLATRYIVILALTVGVFNPSGYSLYHWLLEGFDAGMWKFKVPVTVITLVVVGYIVTTVYKSLGQIGLIAVLAVVAAVLFMTFQIIPLTPDIGTYVAMFLVPFVLAFGFIWAKTDRVASGVVHADADTGMDGGHN